LGLCQICGTDPAQYRCPRCRIKYCSLKCYKSEAHVDPAPGDAPAATELPNGEPPAAPAAAEPASGPMAALLQNTKIMDMLRSPTLQLHLTSVLRLLTDERLAGEHTTEGRRAVALHKLRELRAGGVEENAEVEEFVDAVLAALAE
ncbi:uncharacterized protein V1510DRAFT_368761, partial [Dipodascopsis tothii]|uniref:uncharacterized protein n=1 Tax=Dipodascopsis tothii TaxID=44089 RepID=UPI0034CECBFD